MALIPRPRAGLFVLLPAIALLIPLILPGSILSRSRTAHQTSSHKQKDDQHNTRSGVASSSTYTITPSLWVEEEKSLLALSLDSGAPELTIPVAQVLDIAVDNGRGIVWVGTKKEIIQYGFDGTENFRYPLKAKDDEEKNKTLQRDKHHDRAHDKRLRKNNRDQDNDRDNDKESDKENRDDDNVDSTVHLSLDPSDGSLWIGAGHDVIRMSSDGTEVFRIQEPGNIIDLAVDTSDHTCWVGTKHRITNYDIDSTIYLDFDIDAEHEIIALTPESSTESLWIGTSKGLIKVDVSGQETLRKDGPEHIQDLKTNPTTGDLWVITNKKVYKYSKDGEKLFTVSLCPKDDENDKDHEKEQKIKKAGYGLTECKDGEDSHNNDDDKENDKNCTGNLIALAVDANDDTCWVGTRTTLYKLSDTGETLLKLTGFKKIQALDIGQGQEGPKMLLCPEPFLEQGTHPPTKECAQQVYLGRIHWSRGYIFGQVDDTMETVTIDGIPMPRGSSIFYKGRVERGTWEGTFFWARLVMPGDDGDYPVTIVASNDQEASVSGTIIFIKDMVSPNVTFTSPQNGTVTKDQTVTITGVVDDPTAIVWFWMTGASIPVVNGKFSSPYDMGTGDGTRTIYINATDQAKNTTNASLTIIRDTTAPQITIIAPQDGTYTNNTTVNIGGTITDENPDSVIVSVNNGPAQQMTLEGTNFSRTATIQNKTNTLTIQAKDKAGNTATATRTVYLDQDPPITAILSPAPNSNLTGTVQVSVSATDLLSGIESVILLVDSKITSTQNQAPYNFQLDTFMFSSGSHTITARASDKAGNQTETSIPVTVQRQFGIGINSPATGTIINKSNAIIKGTINMPVGREIGVTINGIPAQQQRTDFAAIIPLQQGQNTITAIATNIYGVQEQASITINTDTAQEQLRLTTTPTSGIMTAKADGTTSFTTTMTVETYLTNTIASYNWDINGDGTPDQTGDLLTQVTGTYQAPGLYFPTITVTDTMGNTYTKTSIVNVLDRATIDALLQAKWSGMKAALLAGNINEALGYFTKPSKERYRQVFAMVGSANITAIFANITELRLNTIYGPIAQYWALRIESGGTFAYPVTFVQDVKGIWMIMGF